MELSCAVSELEKAFQRGDIDFISKQQFKYNQGLEWACRYGHKDLVDLMISKGADYWDEGLASACRGGHKEIALFMISKRFRGWNWSLGGTCLGGACLGGHLDMVQFLITCGVTNWNFGLHRACQGGHLNIVNLMIERGADNFDYGLYAACQGGHEKLVKLMVSRGANNWNFGLGGACEYGHMDIVKLMVTHGADDWTGGLETACENGHIHLVRYMLSQGAELSRDSVSNAFRSNSEDVVQLIIPEIEKQLEQKQISYWKSAQYAAAHTWNPTLPNHQQYLARIELTLVKGAPYLRSDFHQHTPLITELLNRGVDPKYFVPQVNTLLADRQKQLGEVQSVLQYVVTADPLRHVLCNYIGYKH